MLWWRIISLMFQRLKSFSLSSLPDSRSCCRALFSYDNFFWFFHLSTWLLIVGLSFIRLSVFYIFFVSIFLLLRSSFDSGLCCICFLILCPCIDFELYGICFTYTALLLFYFSLFDFYSCLCEILFLIALPQAVIPTANAPAKHNTSPFSINSFFIFFLSLILCSPSIYISCIFIINTTLQVFIEKNAVWDTRVYNKFAH